MAQHLESVDCHRNGVSGQGFHVVKFRDDDNGPMVAVVFPYRSRGGWNNRDNCRIAVFNRDKCAADEWGFGRNSWRGDYYEAFVLDAVRLHEARHATIGMGRREYGWTPDRAYRVARFLGRLARRCGVAS